MAKLRLVPKETLVAAERGFLRTAAQSLASSGLLGGGLTFGFTGDALLALGVAVASAVGTAVVNGAQSYFSIVANGIPEDYQPNEPV